jgi:adenylate cyclase
LAAVMAADVAGYSRLMGADEVGTLAALKAVRREIVDPAITEYRGRIVKTTGDGILVQFASAVDAVSCAMAVQGKMAVREGTILFRIGINIGDIIIDDNDIFGDGVNVAARVETECEPGGVCLSGSAFEQVRGKTNFSFDDLGKRSLKNIDRPVRLYAVSPASARTRSAPASGARKALPLPDKPSIAVLPFQNMSGDPEQEYFTDGVVEDIITALSRFHSLFVIARNSSFTYKGKAVDIKQVAHELGVKYVLEGSVRKAPDRVRVTAQLIEALTGDHLWADRFDQSMQDIFALQDNVTARVVGAVAPRMIEARTEAVVRKPVANWEIYDHYLQAVKLQHQWTLEATLESQRALREIITRDPHFALAYARLAWALQAVRVQYQQPIAESDRKEALALAERAIALSGDDEIVLISVVSVFGFLGGDMQRGRELAERALAINPNMSGAWNVRGVMCLLLGEPDVALDSFSRAIRLNPLDQRAVPLAMVGSAGACNLMGRYDEGEAWARRMLALLPTDFRGLFALLGALIGSGKANEVEATVLKIKREHPSLRASQLRETYRIAKPEFMTLIERGIALLDLPE